MHVRGNYYGQRMPTWQEGQSLRWCQVMFGEAINVWAVGVYIAGPVHPALLGFYARKCLMLPAIPIATQLFIPAAYRCFASPPLSLFLSLSLFLFLSLFISIPLFYCASALRLTPSTTPTAPTSPAAVRTQCSNVRRGRSGRSDHEHAATSEMIRDTDAVLVAVAVAVAIAVAVAFAFAFAVQSRS